MNLFMVVVLLQDNKRGWHKVMFIFAPKFIIFVLLRTHVNKIHRFKIFKIWLPLLERNLAYWTTIVIYQEVIFPTRLMHISTTALSSIVGTLTKLHSGIVQAQLRLLLCKHSRVKVGTVGCSKDKLRSLKGKPHGF